MIVGIPGEERDILDPGGSITLQWTLRACNPGPSPQSLWTLRLEQSPEKTEEDQMTHSKIDVTIGMT